MVNYHYCFRKSKQTHLIILKLTDQGHNNNKVMFHLSAKHRIKKLSLLDLVPKDQGYIGNIRSHHLSLFSGQGYFII